MHIEHDVGPIRDVDPALRVQTLLIQLLQLVEERRHMDDASATDDVYTVRVHESRGQDVEVVGDVAHDDGVARVVATLGTAAQLRLVSEDVGELAFSLVAPLGAEHDGDGHVP